MEKTNALLLFHRIKGILRHCGSEGDNGLIPLKMFGIKVRKKLLLKHLKKTTGKVRGCLVFVLPDMTVKTYFLKDLKGVDKARKGFSVQTFDQKKDGTD